MRAVADDRDLPRTRVQPIWSAATTSTNPGNLPQLITEAAMAIRSELMKEKLIPAVATN